MGERYTVRPLRLSHALCVAVQPCLVEQLPRVWLNGRWQWAQRHLVVTVVLIAPSPVLCSPVVVLAEMEAGDRVTIRFRCVSKWCNCCPRTQVPTSTEQSSSSVSVIFLVPENPRRRNRYELSYLAMSVCCVVRPSPPLSCLGRNCKRRLAAANWWWTCRKYSTPFELLCPPFEVYAKTSSPRGQNAELNWWSLRQAQNLDDYNKAGNVCRTS